MKGEYGMLKAMKQHGRTIMSFIMVIAMILSSMGVVHAKQDKVIDQFKAGTYKDKNGITLPYRYFDPATNNDVKDKYPIILYLHGEDERGTDNIKQITETKGATIWLEPDHLANNPTYVLAPQAPLGKDWTDEKIYNAVKDLLQKFIETHHNVDSDRIYIEGISMGGTGTWNMILKNPDLFAAAMPISGNANAFLSNDAAFAALKNMPIMVVASADDPISPVKGSDDAVEALKIQGNSSVQYHKWEAGSVTPAHNAWATAFEKYEVVYNFLFMNSLAKSNHGQLNPSNLFTSKNLGNGLTQIWDITEDTIFVIERKDKAVVIDTGMPTGSLYQYVRENVLKNKDIDMEILITHSNGDHVKGLPSFIGASQVKKIYLHEAEYDLTKPYFGLDENKVQLIKDGDKIPFDGKDIEVIIVPGHTLGSAVFMYENYLFTGDAIGTGHLFMSSSKISIEDYINSAKHLVDRIAGKSLTVLGGHTGECRYPLDQEYAKEMLECAKGIVNGTITPVTYWRRPGLLATYGRASIYYKADNVTTRKATLSSLALSSDKSNIEIYYPISLNEKFAPLTTNYTTTVDSKNTPYIYIKPTTHSAQDILKINGGVVPTGVPYKVTLAAGDNKFDISVTAKDGTSRIYNLTVTQRDLSKEYKSWLLMPGVWRIEDFAGVTPGEDMYLIEGTDRALLFDTGMGKGDLEAYVKTLTNLPIDVAITHGNGDHFGQVEQFPNSIVYMSDLDATRLPAALNTSKFKWVKEGDVIDIGSKKFEVTLVPGHTLGSIVFLDRADKIAITGDAVSSGSYVFMFSGTCTALDQYVEGLKRFEAKVKDLDGLTLLVGHHWQEKTALTGQTGKRLFSDMRIAGEKVLSGEFEGILNAQNGKNILRQAYFGLAGLWYNPNNLFTDKAALGFLKVDTESGSPVIPKPIFSSIQTSYTATVQSDITNVQITPTAYYSDYKGITINGADVKSGASFNANLSADENKFDITVTGGNGSTKTYTVTITR